MMLDFSKLRLMKPPTGMLNIDDVVFPVWGSIKYDGFRCGVLEDRTWLNSLREVDNLHTRTQLIKHAKVLNAFDGELTVGELIAPDCFSQCQSAFGATGGEPDFTFWVFDRITDGSFEERFLERKHPKLPSFAKLVECVWIPNRAALDAYVDRIIADGHEGVILRRPGTHYKFGRATFRTQEVLRIKPMERDEARIVGFEPEYANTNPKELNNLGRSKRSSAKAGKVAKETLGKLICEHPVFETIKVSGFTAAQALEIWNNQAAYLDKLASFAYQKHGTVDKPRILKFKGIRVPGDMS